jgi:hypothetical protein
MSAWYSIIGTFPVRRCQEANAIVAQIRACCDRDFAVNLVPSGGEVDEFSIEGMGEFAAGGVQALDELPESLGPYSLEAAVLSCQYEEDARGPVVASSKEAAAIALSHHRLNHIRPMLQELNARDRESLVTLLREPGG